MSIEVWQNIKRLTARVEQLEQNLEDVQALKNQIEKLNGEIKAMKARMGKHAKAE